MTDINTAIAQTKNQITNINTAFAQAYCNLNTTNILNSINSINSDDIRNKQIDVLWDAIEILQKQINNTPKFIKLTCMNCGGQVNKFIKVKENNYDNKFDKTVRGQII